MSDTYTGGTDGATVPADNQPSGKVDTAKHEAGQVAQTASQEAGHVVETAKTEAASVAGEAKSQVQDLYAQTQRELREQATTQQHRVAEGLHSVGDELESLAQGAENPGVATDVVRQVAQRVNGIASWLGDRDPGSVLNEVKSYARRKPGTFIAVAAIAGLAVGRLTRALAENAADSSGGATGGGEQTPRASAGTSTPTPAGGVRGVVPPGAGIPDVGTPGSGHVAAAGAGTAEVGTPVYDESRAAWEGTRPDDGTRR
ncbi:hypothetical protein [Microbacterium caowuchunii]|uniref:Uncharacterized protein n=1 Tax=Microbacterium caowuchunii TaxID=2614638 RepID=A0A5N0T546_9MICO|nr:hypothetical protein [Microbacterium caowuchunii]KAA9130053.1 hypothetical protein F6B40_15330 [Microbacterium caowuchunii]